MYVCVCVMTFFFDCRNWEDFITWTDTSKIRAHILDYNEEVKGVLCCNKLHGYSNEQSN